MRRRISLELLVVCALTVPACSSTDQPAPTRTRPAPPTSSSTESVRPTTAPPVAAPVDLCDRLTRAAKLALAAQ
ncbi:MAG TPA: hypothetical protein VH969_18490 [Actinophytocola sp.]|jgi:hypothetical protein|uniref:hypothetical protein n=1 Tax=Actinophytocola sp. TaxID=1872138 RepID=UPI002F93106B